ncbi:MAG: superinfection immunity protein [Gemmatimonadetes bacterium]|nr:superinfection immunity protein [Gemmatimonadota bacterium]MYK50388.1 superinfection immunity protein [Gemmatimonadota bacterium]
MEILLLLAFYAIPTILAYVSRHNNRASILVINLFLGWTVIGWIISLAMALTNNVEKRSTSNKLNKPKIAINPKPLYSAYTESQNDTRESPHDLDRSIFPKHPLFKASAFFVVIVVGLIAIAALVETISERREGPDYSKIDYSETDKLIAQRRARTDSIDRELRKTDGSRSAAAYVAAGNNLNYDDLMTDARIKAKKIDQILHSDIYPPESKRITVTGHIVNTGQNKDQYGSDTVSMSILVGSKGYMGSFNHRESQKLFGQMAALVHSKAKGGQYKDIQITISGIPALEQVSSNYTLLQNCRFIAWHLK